MMRGSITSPSQGACYAATTGRRHPLPSRLPPPLPLPRCRPSAAVHASTAEANSHHGSSSNNGHHQPGASVPPAATSAPGLACSCWMAAHRAAESLLATPLLRDQYAAALAALPQCAVHLQVAGAGAESSIDKNSSAQAASSSDSSSTGQGAPELGREEGAAKLGTAQLADAVVAAYLDGVALEARGLVNMELGGAEYRQVVMLGCGLDTRPHRLPWPTGTLLFVVAPPDAHNAAEASLQAQGARVPAGCLLRRVVLRGEEGPVQGGGGQGQGQGDDDDVEGEALAMALRRAGYQSDKVAVWLLQGLECLAPGLPSLQRLLTAVSNQAAFGSVVAGSLPASLTRRQADNLLGEFSMLGSLSSWQEAAENLGVGTRVAEAEARVAEAEAATTAAASARQQQQQPGSGSGSEPEAGKREGDSSDDGGNGPWLFCSQHRALSLLQMGVYDDHVAAAQDADEDFMDNFS